MEVESLQRARAAKQLIIENVPHLPQENLANIISNTLVAIGCPQLSRAPEDAHRLGKYNPTTPRPPPILVELSSTHVRDSIVKMFRSKKILFSNDICPQKCNFHKNPEEKYKIYINKNYSPSIRSLLKEARKLKPAGFKIFYEFANNVYVKRSLNDEPIRIPNVQFVSEFLQKANL